MCYLRSFPPFLALTSHPILPCLSDRAFHWLSRARTDTGQGCERPVLTCDPPANLYLLLMCPARFHRTTHRLVYCLPSASPTFLSLCIGLSIACLCHLSHIPCARINIYHARTTFSQLFTSLSSSHFFFFHAN